MPIGFTHLTDDQFKDVMCKKMLQESLIDQSTCDALCPTPGIPMSFTIEEKDEKQAPRYGNYQGVAYVILPQNTIIVLNPLALNEKCKNKSNGSQRPTYSEMVQYLKEQKFGTDTMQLLASVIGPGWSWGNQILTVYKPNILNPQTVVIDSKQRTHRAFKLDDNTDMQFWNTQRQFDSQSSQYHTILNILAIRQKMAQYDHNMMTLQDALLKTRTEVAQNVACDHIKELEQIINLDVALSWKTYMRKSWDEIYGVTNRKSGDHSRSYAEYFCDITGWPQKTGHQWLYCCGGFIVIGLLKLFKPLEFFLQAIEETLYWWHHGHIRTGSYWILFSYPLKIVLGDILMGIMLRPYLIPVASAQKLEEKYGKKGFYLSWTLTAISYTISAILLPIILPIIAAPIGLASAVDKILIGLANLAHAVRLPMAVFTGTTWLALSTIGDTMTKMNHWISKKFLRKRNPSVNDTHQNVQDLSAVPPVLTTDTEIKSADDNDKNVERRRPLSPSLTP